MTKKLVDSELLGRALAAIDSAKCDYSLPAFDLLNRVEDDLRAALDAPQQEAVACSSCTFSSCSAGCKHYQNTHPAPSVPESRSVWQVADKTFQILFATKEDADEWQQCSGMNTPSRYIIPVEVPVHSISAAPKTPTTEKYRNGVPRSTVCDCGIQMLAGEVCSVCGYKSSQTTDDRKDTDSFDLLIADARAEAAKAMRKFPQPNYVISKFAEEAGEVVKAAIHCAEGRESAESLRGEMKQAIAMLYRLWVEGDQVHGLGSIDAAMAAQKGEDHVRE